MASAPSSPASSVRIHSIDALRGFASLAVMWYHFTQSTHDFLPDHSWLKASGTYGWAGVEVFFVVSGFVIPYALFKSSYRLAQYGRFLLRRVVRLDPPYLVSVGLSIAAFAVISRARGIPDPRLDPTALLLHIGYLNVYFPNKPWVNVAYWTLAVEVQYYLTVGLLSPLLRDGRRWVRLGLMAVLIAVCSRIPPGEYASTFVLVFLVGFTLFQWHTEVISRLECLLLVMSLCVGIGFTLGWPEAIASALAAALIAPRRTSWTPPRWLTSMGDISYSLYLLHGVTGLLLIPVARDLGFTRTLAGQLLTLTAATVFAISASYGLYYFVERPSRDWASRLGRGRSRGFTPPAAAQAEVAKAGQSSAEILPPDSPAPNNMAEYRK